MVLASLLLVFESMSFTFTNSLPVLSFVLPSTIRSYNLLGEKSH
jgi:hypothetical protein